MRVRSDSVSALTLVMKLKSAGWGSNVVAMEMALDIADHLYTPTVLEHIKGASNITADALSRLTMPGSSYVVPAIFKKVERSEPLIRGAKFFRTL